jgi:hypothetical protein
MLKRSRLVRRIYRDKKTGKKYYTTHRAKDDYRLREGTSKDRFGREYQEEDYNPSAAGQISRGVFPAAVGTAVSAAAGVKGGVGRGIGAMGTTAATAVGNRLEANYGKSKLAAAASSGLSTGASAARRAFNQEVNRTGSNARGAEAAGKAGLAGLAQGAISAIPGGKTFGGALSKGIGGFMSGGWKGGVTGFAKGVLTSPTLGQDVKNFFKRSSASDYNEGTWGNGMTDIEDERQQDHDAERKAWENDPKKMRKEWEQDNAQRKKQGLEPLAPVLPQDAPVPTAPVENRENLSQEEYRRRAASDADRLELRRQVADAQFAPTDPNSPQNQFKAREAVHHQNYINHPNRGAAADNELIDRRNALNEQLEDERNQTDSVRAVPYDAEEVYNEEDEGPPEILPEDAAQDEAGRRQADEERNADLAAEDEPPDEEPEEDREETVDEQRANEQRDVAVRNETAQNPQAAAQRNLGSAREAQNADQAGERARLAAIRPARDERAPIRNPGNALPAGGVRNVVPPAGPAVPAVPLGLAAGGGGGGAPAGGGGAPAAPPPLGGLPAAVGAPPAIPVAPPMAAPAPRRASGGAPAGALPRPIAPPRAAPAARRLAPIHVPPRAAPAAGAPMRPLAPPLPGEAGEAAINNLIPIHAYPVPQNVSEEDVPRNIFAEINRARAEGAWPSDEPPQIEREVPQNVPQAEIGEGGLPSAEIGPRLPARAVPAPMQRMTAARINRAQEIETTSRRLPPNTMMPARLRHRLLADFNANSRDIRQIANRNARAQQGLDAAFLANARARGAQAGILPGGHGLAPNQVQAAFLPPAPANVDFFRFVSPDGHHFDQPIDTHRNFGEQINEFLEDNPDYRYIGPPAPPPPPAPAPPPAPVAPVNDRDIARAAQRMHQRHAGVGEPYVPRPKKTPYGPEVPPDIETPPHLPIQPFSQEELERATPEQIQERTQAMQRQNEQVIAEFDKRNRAEIEREARRKNVSPEEAARTMPESFYLNNPKTQGRYERAIPQSHLTPMREVSGMTLINPPKNVLIKGDRGEEFVKSPLGLLRTAKQDEPEGYKNTLLRLAQLTSNGEIAEAKKLYDSLPMEDRGIRLSDNQMVRQSVKMLTDLQSALSEVAVTNPVKARELLNLAQVQYNKIPPSLRRMTFNGKSPKKLIKQIEVSHMKGESINFANRGIFGKLVGAPSRVRTYENTMTQPLRPSEIQEQFLTGNIERPYGGKRYMFPHTSAQHSIKRSAVLRRYLDAGQPIPPLAPNYIPRRRDEDYE